MFATSMAWAQPVAIAQNVLRRQPGFAPSRRRLACTRSCAFSTPDSRTSPGRVARCPTNADGAATDEEAIAKVGRRSTRAGQAKDPLDPTSVRARCGASGLRPGQLVAAAGEVGGLGGVPGQVDGSVVRCPRLLRSAQPSQEVGPGGVVGVVGRQPVGEAVDRGQRHLGAVEFGDGDGAVQGTTGDGSTRTSRS